MSLKNPTSQSVVLSSGQTVSAEFETRGEVICGILFPAALTGTQITFQAVIDGSDYDIYGEDGTQSPITFTASAFVPLFTDSWFGVNKLKIKSNATELANRTFKILTRARD